MNEISYSKAINAALREELARDERVVVLGEDVALAGGTFGITRGLLNDFGPKRVIDTPIAENSIVGLAVGAAMTGMRPVVEIMFMDFITLCMDQIVNQAAKSHYMFGGLAVPLVVRTLAGAGLTAGPQHSQSLEAWFAHVPGLKVIAPATPRDAKGLLKAAIRDNGPVVFVENKALLRSRGPVPEGDVPIPIGHADVRREGQDVTVVATGQMVHKALKSAELLAGEGISVEVIDLRTISPWDQSTVIESVQKTKRAVIAHEAVGPFGTGAEVAAVIADEAFDYLDAPVKRIGAPFAPVPYSPVLEKAYVPGEEQIARVIRGLV
ncbi:MAG: alpha-ketoacid dehydrogenase subunit beta [Chloroflexota bacterium]|nr:MAG: alpha-ketoacid dehydrogenase subunit beta [Chloroflexota bacterium]